MKQNILFMFGLGVVFIFLYILFGLDEDVRKKEVSPVYLTDSGASEVANSEKVDSVSLSLNNASDVTNKPQSNVVRKEMSSVDEGKVNSSESNYVSDASSFPTVFSLSPVMDGSTLSTENIPDIFIHNASRFNAKLSALHNYPVGTIVEIEIFGELFEANVARHKNLKHGVKNTRLEFGYGYPPEYMTLFSYSDGRARGRIYTKTGNYVFLHNSKTGFLIEENKLHELEGFPITE